MGHHAAQSCPGHGPIRYQTLTQNTMKSKLVNLIIGAIIGAGLVLLFDKLDPPAGHLLEELPSPYYKVLFENDAVRIVEHILNPGETEPTHNHPPMYVYFLEDAEVRVTESDGAPETVHLKKGLTLDVQAVTHSIENPGSSALHSLLVEFKD